LLKEGGLKMSDSPIARVRKSLGLSQHELALFANVGISTLLCYELGSLKPGRKILEALQSLGIDAGRLEAEQLRFIEAKRKAIALHPKAAVAI
jgi:transcriptional regulator with XRE-family HTH domain